MNSGSFVGRGKQARLEDTITRTNLEAAEEVVNQLRLRDIGGIIVIDFIDMARARNRDTVLKTLRKSLDEDRTKTFTAEISRLGLVEMTRQNVTEGVREIMSRPCPTCHGEGVIKSEETIAIDVERKLRELASRAPKKVEAFLVRLHPAVSAQFTGHGSRVLHQLESDTGKFFHFTGSEGLPLDHFDVVKEGSNDEILEEAVPFREGDEVLVQIVEPHMYNVDDAVAKVDGYIISVDRRRPARGRKAPRAHRGGRPDGGRREPRGQRRERRRGRRWRRIDTPAPRPQRRTAPFRCPSSLLGVDMYAIVKTGGKQYRVERTRPCSWSGWPPSRATPSPSSRSSSARRTPSSTPTA